MASMKGKLILIAIPAFLVGCSGLPHSQPVDYAQMPGSGRDMMKGPGLLAGDQKQDYDTNRGYVVYSSNPDEKAAIHSSAFGGSPKAETAGGGNASGSSTTNMKQRQLNQYREFQQYQQFQKFEHYKSGQNGSAQPANGNNAQPAGDYRQFKQWQDWKQYQSWKKHNP